MEYLDAYWLLFKNIFVSNIIIFPTNEYVFDVMLITKKYSNFIICIISVLSSVLASIINYYIGYGLRKLDSHEYFKDRVGAISSGEKIFSKIGYLSLFLACIPLWGGLVTCAAGVFRFNIIKYTILVTLSFAAKYFLFSV